MGWCGIFLAAGVCAIIWFLSGAILLAVLGAYKIRHFLFAPLFAFAFEGAASTLSPLLPWDFMGVVTAYFMVLVVLTVARIILQGKGIASSFEKQFSSLRSSLGKMSFWDILLPACGVALNVILLYLLLVDSMADPSNVIQRYDNPFHYSVVREICETGDANPIGAGDVMGSDGSVYPDLWHANVALAIQAFDTNCQIAFWIMTVAVLAYQAPFSFAALAWRLSIGRRRSRRVSMAISALIPTAVFPGLLSYTTFGSLFANLLGLSLLPLAISASTAVIMRRGVPGRVLFLSVAVSVTALGFSHPSTLFIWGVFVVAAFLFKPVPSYVKIMVTAGSLLLWGILLGNSSFQRTVSCLDRVEPSSAIGKLVISALGLNYDWLSSQAFGPLMIVLLIVLLFGIAAIAMRRMWRSSWYLLGAGIVASLAVCSFFPENWFSIVATGFWYRDAVRLIVAAVVLLAPVIVLACSIVIAHSTRDSKSPILGKTASGLCAICLAALAISSHWYYLPQINEMTVVPSFSEDPTVLTETRLNFLQLVADITGDEAVLNGYGDVGVWLYPLYGANALVKGRESNRMTPMESDLSCALTSISHYASDPAVREAVGRLQIGYVLQVEDAWTDIPVFGHNGRIVYKPLCDIKNIAVEDPSFEVVAQCDGMKLYKIIR